MSWNKKWLLTLSSILLVGAPVKAKPPTLLDTPRTQITRKKAIRFQDRVELVQELNGLQDELSTAQTALNRNDTKLVESQQELEKFAQKAGFTADSAMVLADEECFLNRVTKADAKEYGNLSALVYDIDKQKQLKATKQVTNLDRMIAAKYGQISLLEERQVELSKVSGNEKQFSKFKKSLQKVFGINLTPDATYTEVDDSIINYISSLNRDLATLELQKADQNAEYLEEARRVFAHNIQGMKYEVEGVFHRNNGEFSGLATYDRENKKLVLTFAGSKSAKDWLKNMFGWNKKLSSSHGLLSNIHFHGGFGSHFDDNADSFFSFMRGWLQKFKDENPNAELNLVGTGHSLGGSLGEIFAAASKEMAAYMGIKTNIGIMTFGAPNTVNAVTMENYEKIIGEGNAIRFAHSYDPVPRVVFWKDTTAVTVKKDKSLFRDVNGALELPIRLNPHSSQAYYHAAEKVFDAWAPSRNALKNQVNQVNSLQENAEMLEDKIGAISKIAHEKTAVLVNQDQDSAAVFEDEYEGYIAREVAKTNQLKEELQSLAETLKERADEVLTTAPLSVDETPLSPRTFTKQEEQEFLIQYKDLRQKIEEQEEFVKSLEKDKAWKAYVEQTHREFERMMMEINQSSGILSAD